MTISKLTLPRFTDQPQKTPANIMKENKHLSSTEVGEAQMIMDIAKERVNDIKLILAHSVI